MPTLYRRSSSISEPAFAATTTVLIILVVAATSAFIILLLRRSRHPNQPTPPTVLPRTSAVSARSTPHASALTAPPSSSRLPNPQVYPAASSSPAFSAPGSSPHHPTPSRSTATSSCQTAPFDPACAHTASIAPASSSLPLTDLPHEVILTNPNDAARAALLARLAAMPLTSDTTDNSADTPDRGPAVNATYAAMLARRGIHERDLVALIGSETEEGTDAGSPPLTRVERSSHGGYDPRLERVIREGRSWGRFGGRSESGIGNRRVRGVVEEVEEEERVGLPRPEPLVVRKASTFPG